MIKIEKPEVEAQNDSEKNHSHNISAVREAESIKEAEVKIPAGPLCLLLKCDQCKYTNATEKGLNTKGRCIEYPRLTGWMTQLNRKSSRK